MQPPAGNEVRPNALGARLGAAACLLLASAPRAHAQADSTAAPHTTKSTLDAALLLYAESARVKVAEPTVRVTRLYENGQSLSAQVGIDAITGSTPNGLSPGNGIQATTSPSGRGGTGRGTGGGGGATTLAAGQVPLTSFADARVALDAEWSRPLGRLLTSTLGADFSQEKDYRSIGLNGALSLDLPDKLTTLNLGAAYNSDAVSGRRGVYYGLSNNVVQDSNSAPKHVTKLLGGLSRILTRRWMVGVTASRTWERGYLTEPYKVLSVLDSAGLQSGFLSEKRPDARNRNDVLGSSVYHFTRDILYLSYRHYWDDWDVRSNTFDVKYRHGMAEDRFLEPHFRYYSQTSASFFTWALRKGAPLPAFASADNRLGPLHSYTAGVTYGFRMGDRPGEWTARGEYIRQWGDGHPVDAIGIQKQYDLFPSLGIVNFVVGYTRDF